MKSRSMAILLIVLCILAVAPVVSASSPNGMGTPTLRVVPGATADSAVVYADGITNGGVNGNGAIGWDVYVTLPAAVTINDFTVTPGPAWTSACPGTFYFGKVVQTSSVPGNSAYLISGVCLVPQTVTITGSNIPVFTLTFTSSCTATGNFNVDLDDGPFNDSTDLFDLVGDVYIMPVSGMTDGGAICGPTAVTTSGMSAASSNPAPVAAASWPLLAGAGAVALGGVYALARRKR